MNEDFSSYFKGKDGSWFKLSHCIHFQEHSSFEEVLKTLSLWNIESAWKDSFYHVWHITYEGKALELVYKKKEKISLKDLLFYSRLKLKPLNYPSFDDYKKRFEEGREHLLRGDCYQFNLTGRFEYTWSDEEELNPLAFSSNLVSAYAHMSLWPKLGKAMVSNSPECLFDVVRINKSLMRVISRPIKGTLKEDKNDEAASWMKLKNSKKNSAELNMITDLIRNDLSKIQRPRAKVLAKKLPLKVPGLIHQYSLVACDIDLGKESRESLTLAHIMKAMFPGGSITGAPKQRVLDIIKKLEKDWPERSHYTGSTLVFGHNQIKASINIRTAEIDLNSRRLVYGSGGGITLKSQALDEYEEMLSKVKSFLSPFLSSDRIIK